MNGENPDFYPSESGMVAENTTRGPIWVLKIKTKGFLIIRAEGLSLFTTEQAQFSDLDATTIKGR